MPAGSRTFEKNPEVLKKATEAAHTPEAIEKSKQTRRVNALIKSEVYGSLKEKLLHPDGKGKAYFETFIDKYLAEAKKNPSGSCGNTLAKTIFTEDILNLLDEEQEKRMARDLDFIRYRLIKRLFRQQRDVVLDTDKRKKCVVCSRRAGKTDCASSLCDYVAVTPNSPVLYINLKFNNAISQLYKNVLDHAAEAGLTVDSDSKSEGVITFTNGSSITFGGNNNSAEADKYRGGKYRLIIVDEAGHQRNMKYLVEEVLQPMLADFSDSVIVLQGTPPRTPHTYLEACWDSNEWANYHWTMLDNPYLPDPKKVIQEICKEKGLTEDSPLIQREYFGMMKVYDTEAMVFKDYETYEGEIPTDFIPTHCAIGVDFGWSDFNAVIPLFYNVNTKQAYVPSGMEKKWNKSNVTEIVEKIRDTLEYCKKFCIERNSYFELGNIGIFADTNEKNIIYELSQTYDLPAYCCYKYDKNLAQTRLAECCRTSKVLVPKGGILEDEMTQTIYKRDEGTDAILPEIDDDIFHPDALDAFLYAARQYFYDIGDDCTNKTNKDN